MIGADIGTMSTKSVLYDENGTFIMKHRIGYDLHTPNVDVSEENPDELFGAILVTIKYVMRESKVNRDDIKLVSLNVQMHNLIVMDQQHRRLTNNIIRADNRVAKYAAVINEVRGSNAIYQRTGTPIHPMPPLAKTFWMKHERQDVFQRTARSVDIKTYILYHLFDIYTIDYPVASATGMFNLEALDWDVEMLELLGTFKEMLPELVPITYVVEDMRERYATLMGLNKGTPFVIGASGGVPSNLGVNSVGEGEVVVTVGTFGAIRTMTDKLRADYKGRIFYYVLTKDHCVIGGPVNSGGVVLRWLRDELLMSEVETVKCLGVDPYDVLTQIAKCVRPGTDGLISHPYPAGECAPFWNTDMGGLFLSLALPRKKEHIIHAALEGVLYDLYTVYLTLIEVTNETPKMIKVTGGPTKSEVWRQMMSDTFDIKLVVPESYESPYLGAYVLGFKTISNIEDSSIVSSMVDVTSNRTPTEKNVAVYQEIVSIFINLSRSLIENHEQIADSQRQYIAENKIQ